MADSSVASNGEVRLTAILDREADAAVTVALSTDRDDVLADLPRSMRIRAGDDRVTETFDVGPTSANQTAEIVAELGTDSVTASLTIEGVGATGAGSAPAAGAVGGIVVPGLGSALDDASARALAAIGVEALEYPEWLGITSVDANHPTLRNLGSSRPRNEDRIVRINGVPIASLSDSGRAQQLGANSYTLRLQRNQSEWNLTCAMETPTGGVIVLSVRVCRFAP